MKMILKNKKEFNLTSFRFLTDYKEDKQMGDVNSKYIFTMDLDSVTDIQSYIDHVNAEFTHANIAEVIVVEGDKTIASFKFDSLSFLRLSGNEAGLLLDLTIE